MVPSRETKQQLELLIADLEARIADCQARLPAHSIPPALLAQLDELDDQLVQARNRLQALDDQSGPSSG